MEHSRLKKHIQNSNLIQYLKTFDIIGLNETWSDYKGEFDTFLHDYSCFDTVRAITRHSIRNSGGICVLVKNSLVKTLSVKRIFENFNNCVLLHLSTSHIYDRDIILCFTYISPEGSAIYNGCEEKKCCEAVRNIFNCCTCSIARLSTVYCWRFYCKFKEMLDYIPDDSLDIIFGDVPYDGDTFDIPRQTKDKVRYNSFGQSLVQLCSSFECTYC